MSKYRLILSFELEEDEENLEGLVEHCEYFLSERFEQDEFWSKRGKATLLRDKDRSATNYLLPENKRKSGNPEKGKKIDINDLLK